jgi:CheY-like chemotaxis protein
MPEETLSPMSILIAEDDEANRKVTCAILKHLGYQADAVSNGREALQALSRRPYNVILMNLRMPEMDGFEATKLIRELFPPSHQPTIIALTATVLPNSREVCLNAGMNDFLPKPVNVNYLAKILNKYVGNLQQKTASRKSHSKAFRNPNSLISAI